jgi:hypothetical protein
MNAMVIFLAAAFWLGVDAQCAAPCTTGGSVPEGSTCVFPFTYNGVQYYQCTTADNGNTPWCSLDSTYSSRWGNCVCDCAPHSSSSSSSSANTEEAQEQEQEQEKEEDCESSLNHFHQQPPLRYCWCSDTLPHSLCVSCDARTQGMIPIHGATRGGDAPSWQ